MTPQGLLAYVDPASGSLAIQFLIAALLSGGLIFRRILFRPIAWAVRALWPGREKQAEH
jgi:hypothetical protein